jgi:hypothetical protein
MEAEDGEVLTLDIHEDRLTLVVEWNEFQARSSFVRGYELQADLIEVDATP